MAVARINRELAGIDLAQEREWPITVCTATLDEWRAYLESENQVPKSMWMERIEDTVYIVEKPSRAHQSFTRQCEVSLTIQPAFAECMQVYGASPIPNHPELPDYQPGNSYGPNGLLGAPLPPGVENYLSWDTLVVEIGQMRRWGYDAGMLDWKAREWARFPGLRFILCVKVSDRLTTADYKLYTVERDVQGQALPLPDLDPVPVVGPHTVVTFDSRELLGLPLRADIPPIYGQQFPAPTVSVDLFQVLVRARRNFA